MNFPPLTLKPMEARAAEALPEGGEWVYEPKYDGFRCLAFIRENRIDLRSKSGKPLTPYFPEITEQLRSSTPPGTVLDGEILPSAGGFDELQLRLHPAESRIRRLAREMPAALTVFDLLARDGHGIWNRPLIERRAALEELTRLAPALRLGAQTRDPDEARGWVGHAGLDGIMAKRLDQAYQPGKRAMIKVKVWSSIDCVVGGYSATGAVARTLLLGLYDDEGLLHFVGHARVPAKNGAEMAAMLSSIVAKGTFTGRAPSAQGRRRSGSRSTYVEVESRVVAEVSADHATADFLRHGARLVRFRPDKAPADCRIDQIRKAD